jgi:phosphatidylglycerophosphate synthase
VAALAIAPQHVLSLARVALGGLLYAELEAHDETAWAFPIVLCAVALDLADGRVARARGASSAIGRLIDNASDAVFLAFCFTAFSGEIGATPLMLFALAFGSYALRALVCVVSRSELIPSPRGHWAGIANYSLAVVAGLQLHPLVVLPPDLVHAAAALVVGLNAIAFYDNARLLWAARTHASPRA